MTKTDDLGAFFDIGKSLLHLVYRAFRVAVWSCRSICSRNRGVHLASFSLRPDAEQGVNGSSHSKSGSKGGRGKANPSGKRPSKRSTRGGGLYREGNEEVRGLSSSVTGSGAETNSVGLLLRQQQQQQQQEQEQQEQEQQEQEQQAGVRLGVEMHLPHDQDLDAELALL